MIVELFNTFFYNPIYNLLVFFVEHIPYGDVGVAIILTTILVKVILVPLSLSALKTQKAMREIQPKMKEIQELHKENREEQARQMLALYKEYDVKPFSSILIFLIQIPIVLALYWVFFNEPFPSINTAILYPFIQAPMQISLEFLGYFDVAGKSIILCLLVGVTTYITMRLAFSRAKHVADPSKPKEKTLSEEFMKNMEFQLTYGAPVLIAITIYFFTSSAIALYLITSNLFTIAQEFLIRRNSQA